jgi:hypothetical protein
MLGLIAEVALRKAREELPDALPIATEPFA